MNRKLISLIAAVTAASSAAAQNVSSVMFVNGITVSGGALDLSSGPAFDRRFGMFSDIYYDAIRGDWWALSDRGPGGGTLSYDTRIDRFTIDVNKSTGQISNFQIAETIKFKSGSTNLTGLAPTPQTSLGNSLDPEGIVINPLNGNILVSDEYGPALDEFDRNGNLIRQFTTPSNLIPRNAVGTPNYASDAGNVAGKTTNRGFEGLAISPDGSFAYAMLQSAMLDEGAGNGLYTRIVKFDMSTGQAVAQYAYKLESAAQGRGISSLVALGNDKFLVLERNNRGVGVGATVSPVDKAVYQIDLAGATDISNITLTNGVLPPGVHTVAKQGKVMDLDENTLAALGNKSPEKWEGLAIGPQLDNGNYLILAGTDNDFSVTQNGSNTQFDVYFDFTQSDPYARSIYCPIGTTSGCKLTSNNNPANLTAAYSLLPGVLQAYQADIDDYVQPTPEPATVSLLGFGLVLLQVTRKARSRREAQFSPAP